MKREASNAWVAQAVMHSTLGLGSGYDLMVHEFEPCIRLCAAIVDLAWNSLSPSFSNPLLLALSVSLSK